MVMKYLKLIAVFSVFVPLLTWGQTSEKYSGAYGDYYRAEELFEKEQYSAARKLFSEFLSVNNDKHDPIHTKARYYEGLCALELYNNDGITLLMTFNQDYPENIYKHSIYFKIGQHYYQTKKYEDALIWFEKTDLTEIDSSNISEYYFKVGYAHFQLGNFKKARNAFFEVKDGSSMYASPAMYYFSHIAYQDKSYQVALEGFLSLTEDPTFKKEVPFYISQIYYLQGNYEKVVEFSPVMMDSVSQDNSAQMNQLIGDAYFKIRRFDEAVPYLEDYASKSTTTREDDYQLGYAYFQSTYYDKAIRQFDRVAQKEDRLSQVALYHAAECYIKLEDLNAARGAFERASSITSDLNIQEDALFNYAVLSYELDYNPYNQAIRAFEQFLEKFPRSKRKEVVYEYLVSVYASTKNYKEALASLDRISEKNIQLKTTYQLIAYNWGIELLERENYAKAITIFDKVSLYPIDSKLTGQALFWSAEAHYALLNYAAAVRQFRAFLSVPGVDNQSLKHIAYYNIAYCYFDQQDYVQAIPAFRTFLQLPSNADELRRSDAYLRLGDAYYTKKDPDFEKAAMNYSSAVQLRKENADRALYYLAKTYGFIPAQRTQKISTLLDIVNNYRGSSYTVPAIFEIGLSYKYEGQYEKSFRYLQQIIDDYPKNILVKDALIEIGDLRYKEKRYQEAESYFTRALNEYVLPDSICKSATKGLQDIYRALRQQDRIAEIAEKYPCADITDDDQELFYYETANELYLKENYDEAIPEIEKYLDNYPEGRFSTQLISYLANIYYLKEDKDKALYYYEQIVERPTSGYTEEALVRISKTLYNEGEYADALPYYAQLEKLASTPQVVYNTRIGLMRCNYLLSFYPNASEAATKVLQDHLLNQSIEIEANYIAGMSLYHQGRYREAIAYLKWTEENTGSERGTEALHTLSECYLELDNLSEASAIHKQLLSRKPAYDYWIAKSLMLQARIYIAEDDLFQAENTVNMILNNYPNQEDGVLMEAEKLKAEILQLKVQPEKLEQETNRIIDIQEGDDE